MWIFMRYLKNFEECFSKHSKAAREYKKDHTDRHSCSESAQMNFFPR